MNKKSVVYSGVLLLGLILVSLLLNRGIIQGVASSSDVTLDSDEAQYLLGQTVFLTAPSISPTATR